MADARGKPEQRLIEAAAELMRTKSPTVVSGRELAAQAGVNYGLIHHYFGSKDEVFRAAMRRLATEFADDVEELSEDSWVSIDSISKHERLWRVIAQFALDEEFRSGTEWSYPLLQRRLASLSGRSSTDDARFQASLELIFAFGWVVFKPLVRDAYDLDEDQMTAMAERLDRFLRDL